jgi:hypothetical protein
MAEITNETRAKYKALRAAAEVAYKSAEPQRLALIEAEKPWQAFLGQIDELIDGADVTICEGCLRPIFEGDRSYNTGETNCCAECAPTYQDLRDHFKDFCNADGEPMTEDEARAICDAHVASGGNLSDSMAKVF